jgi:hypothetical protein
VNGPGDIHLELIRLLSDGEWHDYHEMLGKAAKVVQPGAALRACERNRALRERRRHNGEFRPRTQEASKEDQIRTGARQLVQSVMLNKAFEIDPPGKLPAGTRKKIRLRSAPQKSKAPLVRVARTSMLDAAKAVLADGEWHEAEEVLKAAAAQVPEDLALRNTRSGNVAIGARRAAYKSVMVLKGMQVDRSERAIRLRFRP